MVDYPQLVFSNLERPSNQVTWWKQNSFSLLIPRSLQYFLQVVSIFPPKSFQYSLQVSKIFLSPGSQVPLCLCLYISRWTLLMPMLLLPLSATAGQILMTITLMMWNSALLLIKVIQVIVIKVIDDNHLDDGRLSTFDAVAGYPLGKFQSSGG